MWSSSHKKMRESRDGVCTWVHMCIRMILFSTAATECLVNYNGLCAVTFYCCWVIVIRVCFYREETSYPKEIIGLSPKNYIHGQHPHGYSCEHLFRHPQKIAVVSIFFLLRTSCLLEFILWVSCKCTKWYIPKVTHSSHICNQRTLKTVPCRIRNW